MNVDRRIVRDIKVLVSELAPACSERATLDELAWMLDDPSTWSNAHDLFTRIREKTLRAERMRDSVRSAQYSFEEVCAQTLYNLSDAQDPFDPDTPYWIAPNAFGLARALGLQQARILNVIAAE